MKGKAKAFKPGKRKSKYDQYKEEIIKYSSQGFTVQEILDELDKKYGLYDCTHAGLYNYIKTRDIKHLSRKSKEHAETICDGCQFCEKLTMNRGNINKFCMLSKRQIFYTTTTSPFWCEKNI